MCLDASNLAQSLSQKPTGQIIYVVICLTVELSLEANSIRPGIRPDMLVGLQPELERDIGDNPILDSFPLQQPVTFRSVASCACRLFPQSNVGVLAKTGCYLS